MDWVVSRIGDRYDIAQAWRLATKLLGLPLPSAFGLRSKPTARSATRFICSSLLAQAFLLVGLAIEPAQIGIRDAGADHRYVTPSDFGSAPSFEVVA